MGREGLTGSLNILREANSWQLANSWRLSELQGGICVLLRAFSVFSKIYDIPNNLHSILGF